MTHPKLDDAALKADKRSIEQAIRRILDQAEDLHKFRDDIRNSNGGTPRSIERELIAEELRALLQRSQPVAVVPAEQAEDSLTIDRAVLVRAAAALSAYLSAMRAEDGDDRESLMARIRGADKMAHAAYTELYAVLHSTASVSNREAGGS